jgi:hypothetical protein
MGAVDDYSERLTPKTQCAAVNAIVWPSSHWLDRPRAFNALSSTVAIVATSLKNGIIIGYDWRPASIAAPSILSDKEVLVKSGYRFPHRLQQTEKYEPFSHFHVQWAGDSHGGLANTAWSRTSASVWYRTHSILRTNLVNVQNSAWRILCVGSAELGRVLLVHNTTFDAPS